MLTALTATGGPINAVKYGLYQNNLQPGQGTQFTDFTACDFDGYAVSAAVVWGAVYTNAEGFAEADGQTLQFTCTGSTTQNTVYGYYAYTGTNTLVYAEKFDQPIPVGAIGDAVVVVPQFTLVSQLL
jgi:hypothetical protein